MTTVWNEEMMKKANIFTNRIEEALVETGAEKNDWCGYVFGWMYGQLRQRLSKEAARKIIEDSLTTCEEKLDNFAET